MAMTYVIGIACFNNQTQSGQIAGGIFMRTVAFTQKTLTLVT